VPSSGATPDCQRGEPEKLIGDVEIDSRFRSHVGSCQSWELQQVHGTHVPVTSTASTVDTTHCSIQIAFNSGAML
jgi:hypothetical protein